MRTGRRRLMTLASRVNLRDLRAQLWLLSQDLRVTNVDSALQHIDVMLRGQNRRVIERLEPAALAQILTREPYRLAYAKLLLTNPPWRPLRRPHKAFDRPFGIDLSVCRAPSPRAGADGKRASGRFEQVNSTTACLTRLMIYGCGPLPPERREEADLLYNQGFRYQLTNLPFDWVIAPVPNATVRFETQAGAQAL